jgi:hypothetical protein
MTTDYFDDDESVIATRQTARVIGLTQLLIDIYHAGPQLDAARMEKALALLGVSTAEIER